MKDLIINVDDSPPEKEQKKIVKKIKEKSLKQGNAKVKEVDGLGLLSTTLDLLKWWTIGILDIFVTMYIPKYVILVVN